MLSRLCVNLSKKRYRRIHRLPVLNGDDAGDVWVALDVDDQLGSEATGQQECQAAPVHERTRRGVEMKLVVRIEGAPKQPSLQSFTS